MYKKSYCTTPGVGVGGGSDVSKILKFYIKVFNVVGKALSGELSCTRTSLLVAAVIVVCFSLLVIFVGCKLRQYYRILSVLKVQ